MLDGPFTIRDMISWLEPLGLEHYARPYVFCLPRAQRLKKRSKIIWVSEGSLGSFLVVSILEPRKLHQWKF
jgi:hypothetical protein